MKLGIADTMFARVDMFRIAKKAIDDYGASVKVERYTVPGVKDLPVACKKLIEECSCDVVMAMAMPGPETIDKQCAHEASQGIIQVQLMTNRHVLEVFVHLDEGKDEKDLYRMTVDRTYDHTINALKLLEGKESLSRDAGRGIRQGQENAGELR